MDRQTGREARIVQSIQRNKIEFFRAFFLSACIRGVKRPHMQALLLTRRIINREVLYGNVINFPRIKVTIIEGSESQSPFFMKRPTQLQRPDEKPKNRSNLITINDLLRVFIYGHMLINTTAECPGANAVHIPKLGREVTNYLVHIVPRLRENITITIIMSVLLIPSYGNFGKRLIIAGVILNASFINSNIGTTRKCPCAKTLQISSTTAWNSVIKITVSMFITLPVFLSHLDSQGSFANTGVTKECTNHLDTNFPIKRNTEEITIQRTTAPVKYSIMAA